MWRYFSSLLLFGVVALAAESTVTQPHSAINITAASSISLPTSNTEHSVLRFGLYYPHLTPYIYTEPSHNQVVGIVPEVLAPFFAQQGITIEYVFDKVSALERRLHNNDIDMMILNASWAINPEQVLFSDGIVPYNDYLYSRSKQQQILEPEQLDNKTICTRQYYVYPKLAALFTADLAVRVDSSSQAAQLRMLFSKRCDYAYINEIVAKWELQKQFMGQQVYLSAVYQDESMLTLAVSQKWQQLLPELNQFLQQQQQSGEINRVINQYVKYDYGYNK